MERINKPTNNEKYQTTDKTSALVRINQYLKKENIEIIHKNISFFLKKQKNSCYILLHHTLTITHIEKIL